MKQFEVLYRYELKKLLQKKILWVTLFVCIIGISFSLVFPLVGYYSVDGEIVDSNYNLYLTDMGYRQALNGKPIDQALLKKTIDAYSHVPMEQTPYSQTEEYQLYARPYSEIFNLIRTWTQLDAVSAAKWSPDEAVLYDGMIQTMQQSWSYNYLTDTEMTYWQNNLTNLQTPFVYQYHDGYLNILEVFLTVGFMVILFIAIALSTAFPYEHLRRTDQLILSTAKGREQIYWIKLTAGLTIGLFGALLISALTWVLALIIYGAEGFDAVVQLFYTSYAGKLTIGQTCLIAYGCLLITALMMSTFAMFLSELLHSGIASLSIITGFLLASALVQMPAEYRILSQLWDYFPTSFLAMWNVFDCRLILLFGHCFTSYQIVPLVYIAASILLAIAGKHIYLRYQVSGR